MLGLGEGGDKRAHKVTVTHRAEILRVAQERQHIRGDTGSIGRGTLGRRHGQGRRLVGGYRKLLALFWGELCKALPYKDGLLILGDVYSLLFEEGSVSIAVALLIDSANS